MAEPAKITWYRCKVDKAVMRELMRKRNGPVFRQALLHLGVFAATGTLAYLAFLQVHVDTWPWALPLLFAALFLHGTFSNAFGGIAPHELCHKTPFATPFWNDFFLYVFSFFGWFDPIGYRASHIRHHQSTTHVDHDGEVVLPQGLDWHGVKFVLNLITFSPTGFFRLMRFWVSAACGNLNRDGFFKAAWLNRVVPDTSVDQRRSIVRWARFVVLGHLALATLFVVTGHWFLIVIVNFGCMYSSWLMFLTGGPQHAGLSPDTPDHRLCCRTYTCSFIPAFVYWNMQYHVEHHMFPAVPFYNLGKLRAAIEHDLPPAPHGLWATWKEIVPILRRQRAEPGYHFVPPLPKNEGDRADDLTLHAEASQSA